MNITVETYENALKTFLEEVDSMKDDVMSVLLFGSMARGDVRPPRSDVMDAFLFFKPEVFRDRERFLRDLQIMVSACEQLSQTGLEFHPFLYWENIDLIIAAFLPTFRSTRVTRIVFGRDMRDTIDGTPASRFLARTTFFAIRRHGHQLTHYLSKPQWTELEREQIAAELLDGRKYIPVFGGLTLNIYSEETELISEFQQALPEVDMSVLDKVKTLRDNPELISDAEGLRQMLIEMLTFVEEAHDRLVVKLRERGDIEPPAGT